MKIAISTQSADIDSLVDPRFGRARWFIVADTTADTWEAIDNAAGRDGSGGSGIQAGSTVAERQVEAVITGNVGPNAHRVLSAADIAVYQVAETGGVTARDALTAFGRGELSRIGAPTAAGR
jgi:predicted Fe-Mo cluster-binding NifX family protein